MLVCFEMRVKCFLKIKRLRWCWGLGVCSKGTKDEEMVII